MDPFVRRLPQPPAWFTYVLFGLVLASLALHLWSWYTVQQYRALAREQLVSLADQMAQAKNSVITAEFPVNQRVPINTTIPVKKSLTVPFSTRVKVDDTVTVPLGGLDFPVPIRADIPVNATVPITIDETVAISTTVQLNLTVPIRLPVANSSFEAVLNELEQRLRNLAGQL